MEHTWGTPETQPPEVEDLHVGAAHLYLIGGWVALAVAVVGIAVDYLTPVTVSRGVFSVLAVLAVAGFSAWSVKAAEARNRRDLSRILAGMCTRQHAVLDQLAELTSAVEKLRAEAGNAHVTYLQAPRPQGHMYLSQSAGCDGDTVPLMPKAVSQGATPPVDPEALREEVERVVAEELGTRESVRSQGYAEGYVDGVARRKDDDPPN